MKTTPVKTALYRLFGDEDILLYIGITDKFGTRWQQHARLQPWWPEVRRQTVEWHPDRDAAEDAEEEAIRTERPRYNVTHNWESTERCASSQDARTREVAVRHGAVFRKLRRENGLSQAALAELMVGNGWPWYQNTVCRVERGERPLSLGEAFDLATLYGVSLDALDELSHAAVRPVSSLLMRGAA